MSETPSEIDVLRAALAAAEARAAAAEEELTQARAVVSASDAMIRHLQLQIAKLGVVCGRGRNPTLRLWPAIFSGEIDVFPSERRNMGQEIGR